MRRRFIGLTALRWASTGFLLPVTVVLGLERGLSLTAVGAVFAIQSVTVIVLELPTGGLADAIGRRPVLVGASFLDLASVGILVIAESVPVFAVAMLLQGLYRALESGPLESWFVDASLAADPDADIETGLARSGAVVGAAIAVGSLGGAGLALVDVPALPVLAAPLLAALAVRVLDIGALWAFLVEVRPGRGRAALMAGARDVPSVVRGASTLLRRSPALLALVGVELLWGGGMAGIEMLSAPRMVELLGDVREGVAAIGIAGAVAWSTSGLGAGAAPWLTRRLGTPARAAAALRVAQGAGLSVAALVAGPVGLITGYLGFYLVHGASNAVHYGMVHRLAPAHLRTTAVSANALASRIGGTVAGIALAALADGAGIPLAMGIAAVLCAAGAPLYVVAGRGRPVGSAAPQEDEDQRRRGDGQQAEDGEGDALRGGHVRMGAPGGPAGMHGPVGGDALEGLAVGEVGVGEVGGVHGGPR